MVPPRHAGRLGDLRPLDRFGSIKLKLGVLVTATVTLAVLITWVGLYNELGPRWTLPTAVLISLLAVQVLARGMTSPLREMTAAARAMAAGDYSKRVRATSRDEVGQLAEAFNTMARDLEQVDTLRREMVANVSHELRTPVAALRAQLENMVDGVTEPDETMLEAALAQTERLGRLVTYLLDLSRIEAGAVGLDITDVPLGEFLRRTAREAQPVAAEKGVRFAVSVRPEGLSVPADGERLHQVASNLLHNAVRHSPVDGEVRLTARTAGSRVVLDVADDGPGIPPEERRLVFDRFRRGNAPAQTGHASTGGTGLGLSIVRWVVELHGGTVQVADTPTGCTMRVTLPADRSAPPSDPPSSPLSAQPSTPSSEGGRPDGDDAPRTVPRPAAPRRRDGLT